MVAERPPDPSLEESTNKWMTAGLVIMGLMVLAFPLYRFTEPANRDAARESHIASLAQQGEAIYQLNCTACHGVSGEGGIGPALNSQQFLAAANDEQIGLLIAVGVPGTEMNAYALDFGGPLTSEQIAAIVTFLRSLEPNAPDVPDWRNPGDGAGG
jgi:mono/diheme cytochrome c family protein